MDDYERQDVTREFREKPKAPNRMLRLLGRVAALVATIALVLGAVYLVVHRDAFSMDALRRAISYSSSSGEASQFVYSGNTTNSFAALDGGLLVCSANQLQLFTKSGDLVVEESVSLSQPVICAEGDYALVYDAAGTALYVLHDRAVTLTYSPDKGRSILGARINAGGWLTILEQATGYKASVTVYNADFQPVVTENISSSFIIDAILSPDEKTLALVSIGEESGGFDCAIIFYNVSDGTERSRCPLGGDVVLDLQWEKDALWAVGEYGAYCIRDEAIVASYTDSTRYLQGFSLGGSGFAALYYSKYQGGSTGSVVLLTESGETASIDVNEPVRSVSAAGNYLAVLTASDVTIYKPDLSVYGAGINASSARRVLMREDGSALLISSESALLFLPD